MLQNVVQDYIWIFIFCIEIQVTALMQISAHSSCSLDSSLSIVFTAIESTSKQSSSESHLCFLLCYSITRVELERGLIQ
jgi:hypothetical protein